MKLLGLITDVNQKNNKNLIGQLVILEKDFVFDFDDELCYRETWDQQDSNRDWYQECLPMLHGILNVEIIGEY